MNKDEELTKNDIKRMDADDQAIQTILLGHPEDVYADVDSCKTVKEIWERVRQMMKGSDIGEQEKKAKLFNEWEKFTSTDGESIESYYYLCQTKNLHEADFTQIYEFLKTNQDEDRQIQNVGGNGGNRFGQYVSQVAQNQQGYNAWQNGIANQNGTGNIVAARAEGSGNGNQASDLDEIEEVNANCILMANLQHASTSGNQLDKAPAYDTDGSAEVQLNDNCYDNEIFNIFTQEEQYTNLLEPIPEPHLVPQNDNHVTSVASSMVQSGGIVETSSAPNKETRAHQETVYHNLVNQVAQDQTVQTMHMLNPKPNSFYHPGQKMALGYPNPSYLKKAQLKQQSLYNGNRLLEEHDPLAVYNSKETLELAQESRKK
uniref:Uncharacterized protein n=1 Tax=Tanacetum cinerariifolium TaxID=118510 RepID=A0A699I5D3_TANCI|nr:hypothetical protein [Tanacetum cinerariifolium]